MWWLVTVALAGGAGWDSPALEALDRGDAAWFSGERRAGARAWREVLDLASDAPRDRAVEAMARLRLLRAGSTLAPLWHGPGINDALTACGSGPWCTLATVDFHLLAPPVTGADPEVGLGLARDLADRLPARSTSRVALATGDTAPLRALEEPLDGLGRALLAGRVPDPGPWTLGVGLVAARAPGVGATVHLVHPDLGRRGIRAGAGGWLATASVGAEGWVRFPGTWAAVLDARGARWRWWDGVDWVPTTTARIGPGLAWRPGRITAEVGPLARWDLDANEILAGHGAWARLSMDGRDETLERGAWVGLSSELALPPLAAYPRQGFVAELRGWLPMGLGVLAGRTAAEVALGEVPEVRLPTVGGSGLLRGARPGELRGTWTAGAEVELRHPVWGPLWVAGFGGAAAVEGEGLHPGGGAGIRWVLPPRPQNTVRLDLGFTDMGWDLVVGWGEAI